jgi:drug/metabolite transporter (DMT)-like permease
MKLSTTTLIGAMAISVAAILWGFDGIVLTPRLYNLNITYVVFMVHCIPFLILNFFCFKAYKELKSFSKSDFLYFFLIALFGGAIGTLAIVKALFLVNFQSLTVVVLLQKLQPVFAIILAAILLKEKLHKGFVLWASIAIMASYFLAFGFRLPDFHAGSRTTLAALFSLLAAFSFGSATVFGKKVLYKVDFISATFFRINNRFFNSIATHHVAELVYIIYYSIYNRIRGSFPFLLWLEKSQSDDRNHL